MPETSIPQPSGEGGEPRDVPAPDRAGGPVVVRDLPCAHCRYNLRGLGLRSVCPECGLPVRATLATTVDPDAENLERLYAPRLTAIGLIVWSLGACVCAAALWADRALSVARALAEAPLRAPVLQTVGLAGIAASGIAALVLVRPHRGVRTERMLLTILGVLLYAPLGLIVARLFNSDPLAQLTGVRPQLDHAMTRLHLAVVVSAIIVLLRPAAVHLAMRSLVVRTGRVDRQPMWTLIPPLLLAAAGEFVLLGSAPLAGAASTVLRLLAVLMVVGGSTLLTIGLGGIFVDTWRLRTVIAGRDVLSVFEALGRPDGAREGLE